MIKYLPSLATAPRPRLVHACDQAPAGYAHCLALVQQAPQQPHIDTNTIAGLHPTDLQTAYNLPSLGAGGGQTVAIVDAYDDPSAEADLALYRSAFGLIPCTTDNGCYRKVDQWGGTAYPKADVGWSYEISLDLDMVSAICPNCNILLVEANNSSFFNLGTGVETAVSMGANEVSNSYGGSEAFYEALFYESYYNYSGVVITASTGDNGYGVEIPAAFKNVVAVGGTSLTPASNARGWSETAWSGAGSGCSRYIGRQSWQPKGECGNKRSVADVSAVADPNTGVSVYDSYNSVGGWLVFGGTSVSSPIIASVYALAGNAANISPPAYLYNHKYALNDIIGGSNGTCKLPTMCNAVPGYDGPTGLGTPNGTDAF
jgi:subtilase family serine protease